MKTENNSRESPQGVKLVCAREYWGVVIDSSVVAHKSIIIPNSPTPFSLFTPLPFPHRAPQVRNQSTLSNRLRHFFTALDQCVVPVSILLLAGEVRFSPPIVHGGYLLRRGQRRSNRVRRDESVVEDYHGVKIADPYRWLEDPDSEETKEFVQKQVELTQSVLKECGDIRGNLSDKITKLFDHPRYDPPFRRGR
ncbi:hypothetical protein ACLB2K_018557 [Fragaria x ananassa]